MCASGPARRAPAAPGVWHAAMASENGAVSVRPAPARAPGPRNGADLAFATLKVMRLRARGRRSTNPAKMTPASGNSVRNCHVERHAQAIDTHSACPAALCGRVVHDLFLECNRRTAHSDDWLRRDVAGDCFFPGG